MTADSHNRLKLGAAEWATVFGLLGALMAWAQMMHSRLSVIETVVHTEVPRISRTLESLQQHMIVVTRLEQHSQDLGRRVERLEKGR